MNIQNSKERLDDSGASNMHGMKSALIESFVKLAPKHIIKNPVMAVVWAGTVLTAAATLAGLSTPGLAGQ